MGQHVRRFDRAKASRLWRRMFRDYDYAYIQLYEYLRAMCLLGCG